MSALLRYYGHACFGLNAIDGVQHTPTGSRFVIDPYPADGFGGRLALAPLPDHFDFAVCSHEHADHSAVHELRARRVHPPDSADGVVIDAHRVFHDEYGGRLRSGSSNMLRLRCGGVTVIHAGDIGERPTGAALRWLRESPVDALIVPVGGFFTLGPDGAAELAALVQPRFVVPCHGQEGGARIDEIGSVDLFTRRFDSVLYTANADLYLSPVDTWDEPCVAVLKAANVTPAV